MTSLETRNTSALFKRAEQLKRWQESDTSKEPTEPKRKSQRIQFTDGCVFLAACAASDKDEVIRLTKRGADIDTANIDGLTALHQACIDDNLEMVEFLVERGADVNRGDNEGWTPLHATASCGFLSIAKYLLEHGANVSAVNNDGELPIDISESDEMEDLLQKEIDKRGVNCEESRNTEEHLMLEDARSWVNAKVFGDVAHTKTGATALHVAAAKGYIKVMGMLIQAGAAVNSQDLDGWTPLHAAAHWAQREACEILCENYANMDIKNYVGQTAFDVADPDVLRLLEELKKKQATLQKDRPDIRYLFNRPPVPPGSGHGGKRRSSITRLSVDDKALRSKDSSTQERDLLLHKSMVSETIQERRGPNELESPDVEVKPPPVTITSQKPDDNSGRAPGYSPPHFDDKVPRKTLTVVNAEGELEEVHPWRRPASLRVRPTFNSDSISGPTNKLSPAKDDDDVQLRRVHSFESDEKFYAKLTELRNRIRAGSGKQQQQEKTTTIDTNQNQNQTSSNLESQYSSSRLEHHGSSINSTTTTTSLSPTTLHEDSSLSSTTSSSSTTNTSSSTTNPSTADSPIWTRIGKKRDEANRPKSEPPKQQPSQVRRSFVPPVRDEESETQRKAHAKRVRETRRSTQGVTLEDLKSAERLVKRKQQQENQQRTSELQQLVASQQQQQHKPSYSATSTASTATTTTTSLPSVSIQQPTSGSSPSLSMSSVTAVTTSPSIAAAAAAVTSGSSSTTSSVTSNANLGDTGDRHERRPSWRLRLDSSDKTKFRLEDDLNSRGKSQSNSLTTSLARKGSKYDRGVSADPTSPTIPEHKEVTVVGASAASTTSTSSTTTTTSSSPSTLHPSNHRRKKPKRRSTGVVNLDADEQDGDSGEEEPPSPTTAAATTTTTTTTNVPTTTSESGTNTSSGNRGGDRSQNGEIDYRKLWEQAQLDNSKLRDDLAKARDELKAATKKLEAVVQAPVPTGGLTETEKKEKQALEKKLSEMEEELKQLEHLKNDNQRLRDENGALIRVISKLSK